MQSCQLWMSTFAESNDMCVVKAMTYEEKPQTHVVEIARMKEAGFSHSV